MNLNPRLSLRTACPRPGAVESDYGLQKDSCWVAASAPGGVVGFGPGAASRIRRRNPARCRKPTRSVSSMSVPRTTTVTTRPTPTAPPP